MIAVAFIGGRLLAEDAKKEEDRFEIKQGVYQQSDSGGQELVDEDETIFETIILVSKKIDDKNTVNFRFLADIISSASIERDHNQNYRALQSGASGNTNFAGTIGWTHKFDGFDLGLNGSFGKEYAYDSMGYGINATVPLNNNNTILTGRLQFYNDTVRMIRFDGREDADKDRDTFTVEFGVIQTLTPEDILHISFNHTEQDGFLATSYNSVFLNNVLSTETEEVSPKDRSRNALTTRYKHSLDKMSSYEMGYRLYDDDWGINSHTLDFRYFQYNKDKSLLHEPHYQFYLQSEADFYEETFTGFTGVERTSDPDLGDFTAHALGYKVTVFKPKWFGYEGDWDFDFTYVSRSNDLNSMWFVTGYKTDF